MEPRFDKHHLLFTEQHWSSNKTAQALRTQQSLIIRLSREVHEENHRQNPAVPLLGYYTLSRTLSMYEPEKTPLASAESLMTAIEIAANHPRAHDIEKNLAELAIWAIDLQRPFIKNSPDEPRANVIDLTTYRTERELRELGELPPAS